MINLHPANTKARCYNAQKKKASALAKAILGTTFPQQIEPLNQKPFYNQLEKLLLSAWLFRVD
jgi:hypothetical protein